MLFLVYTREVIINLSCHVNGRDDSNTQDYNNDSSDTNDQ